MGRNTRPPGTTIRDVDPNAFETADGTPLTAVTAEEMAAVDRIATETVGLPLYSMMENAGRNLASVVRKRRGERLVVVFAGGGGNGGGGFACVRHLLNRGVPVTVVADRPASETTGAAGTQRRILETSGVAVRSEPPSLDGRLAVDALVGYGLSEALRGTAADLAAACNDADAVVSLDVPTGVNATTGAVPGVAVDADATLTLALPKTGLGPNGGELLLGDIGIPASVYERLEIPYQQPFEEYVVRIRE
jgi:NAD(P)H-hydrate epimerase